MRRSIIFAFLFIFILTLLVWGISYFLQPLLPQGINNAISLFFTTLVGVTGVLGVVGFVDFLVKYTSRAKWDIDENQMLRNRRNMLQVVWNTWIEGVLRKSLYNEVMIELGMETKPDAVEHPWEMVLQMPKKDSRPILKDTKMLELFDAMNGAMLILGEPGAGKTTMLLELCRQAIERGEIDISQPIPVIFNLSSWNPKQTLSEWLIDELHLRYYIPKRVAQVWIECDELILLLDGLDELLPDSRPQAVQAINRYIDEHRVSLAVCSRSEDYERLDTQLKLHGAVLIQPLTIQQVETYLQSANPSLISIHQALQHDPELQELARTPLFLNILVLAFRNASNDDLVVLTQSNDYRKYLFDTYIVQMFKRRGVNSQEPYERSIKWLKWLAQTMIRKQKSIFHIENIQPSWVSASKSNQIAISCLVIPLFTFPIFALLGFSTSVYDDGKWLTGLLRGGLLGIIGGGIGMFIEWAFLASEKLRNSRFYAAYNRLFSGLPDLMSSIDSQPADKLVWSRKLALKGTIIGSIFTLFLSLIWALIATIQELSDGHTVKLSSFLIIWMILFILLASFLMWFYSLYIGVKPSSKVDRNKPGDGIRLSFRNFLQISLISGLIYGLPIGLFMGFMIFLSDLPNIEPISSSLFGLLTGCLMGLITGMNYGGEFLGKYLISRVILYHSGHIPWNLVAFLDYATERIFLRRVGGGYIFIHRMLMEHFAAMGEDKIPI